MSIITAAQSKGGAGKTTIAQLIVSVVRSAGSSVAVIDGDVNHTLATWIEKLAGLSDVETRIVQSEENVIDWAGELEQSHDLVVIDTAGAKNQSALYAIGASDLVLIPAQTSSANVIEANNTFQTVQSVSKIVKRDIPARVVLTDYTPGTNIAKHIRREIQDFGLPLMKTILHRLVAFQELSYGEFPKTGTACAQAQLLVQEIEKLGVLPFMNDVRVVA